MKIRIFKEEHSFAASHFLIEMGKCERLHGHNYTVTVEIGGSLNSNGVIVDFNEINPVIKNICDSLDHKTIIAEKEKRQKLTFDGAEIEILFKNKRFVFPKEDCVLLPIESTTVERLSSYICGILEKKLGATHQNIEWLEVGVREGAAQMAITHLSSTGND